MTRAALQYAPSCSMERRMNARNLKLLIKNSSRRFERGALVLLSVLFALGLWQGYGAWLFDEHVH
jgi:hypothetical protein